MKLIKFYLLTCVLSFCLNSYSETLCTQYIGTCDYYQCLENQSQCGENGYYLDFGLHYCKKYLSKTHKFSKNGQLFLNSIRSCLQIKLENQNEIPQCNSIKKFAIKSHEECYKEHNFCSLKLTDRLKIEWIAKSEIFDQDFAQFATYLNQLCYPHSNKNDLNYNF